VFVLLPPFSVPPLLETFSLYVAWSVRLRAPGWVGHHPLE